MGEYDSILKEKKVYAELEPIIKKNKFTKYFSICFIAFLVIMCISYLFYYQNILSPKNVLLYDFNSFYKLGESLLSPLNVDILNDTYSLEGTMSIDQLKYQYEVTRDGLNMNLLLTNNDKSIHYYIDNNSMCIHFNHFLNEQCIEQDELLWINLFRNVKYNLHDVLDDSQMIKRFYFENKAPVVEVNWVLDRNSLNRLLGTTFTHDEINISFTFKNNAFSGELLDGSLIIQNKTKNERYRIDYQDNSFLLTDNLGNVTKYLLQFHQNDFSLKIFKDDELYSVLSGTSRDDSYLYSYQIIEKIYNLSLEVLEGDNVTYHFTSSIGYDDGQVNEKELSIINSYDKNSRIVRPNLTKKSYSSYSETEKNQIMSYRDELILPIRNFVIQYKDGIN